MKRVGREGGRKKAGRKGWKRIGRKGIKKME